MNRYYVRIGEEIRGPFAAEQLRDFADAGVVTRTTPAAAAPAGPWMPVATLPEQAVVFPPRVELGFKPTAFVAVNDGLPTAVDVRDAARKATPTGRLLRPRSVEPPAPSVAAAVKPAENEVEAMVREVNEIEAHFAPPPPPPPKRRVGFRLWLVATLAVFLNAGLLFVILHYGVRRDDELTPLVLGGWFIIGNGGLVYLYVLLPRK